MGPRLHSLATGRIQSDFPEVGGKPMLSWATCGTSEAQAHCLCILYQCAHHYSITVIACSLDESGVFHAGFSHFTPFNLSLSWFPGTDIYVSLDSFSCRFQETQLKRLWKSKLINVYNWNEGIVELWINSWPSLAPSIFFGFILWLFGSNVTAIIAQGIPYPTAGMKKFPGNRLLIHVLISNQPLGLDNMIYLLT